MELASANELNPTGPKGGGNAVELFGPPMKRFPACTAPVVASEFWNDQ